MDKKNAISVFMGEPTSIDPCYGSEHDGALVLRFLSDPLIDFTPDTGEAKPAAAKSWQVEDDGYTIRLFLRENVFFHHGRNVTAEDYIYSWNRLVSPSQNSELSYHLSSIKGFDEVRSGISNQMSGLKAIGTFELLVSMSEPFAEVPALFGHHCIAAVPKELVESNPEKFKDNVISTGPYMLAEPWAHNKYVRLKRFDKYYEGNEAFIDGGKGYLDEIEFRIYEDINDAYSDWKEGKLDITKVPPTCLNEAMSYGDNFRSTQCALMQYIGFPNNIPPFNNKLVRQAIALGTKRKNIIDKVFSGTRPLATSIIPPNIKSNHEEDINNNENILLCEPDVDKALNLLEQAGMKLPLKVPFYYNSGLGHESWINEIKQQLAQIKIELDLKPLPWGGFLNKLQNGIDGMFRMTWAIDCPSPDNVLFSLFHSNSIGMDNFSNFSDVKFDATLKEARSILDTEQRMLKYQEAENIIINQLPILPLWYGIQYHMVSLNRFEFLGNRVIDIFGEPVLRHVKMRID
ncbi:ABC transporter substrate-binding protein [Lysinibacillus mangiferihumi]|uniref:ABC transporter substrate-binding protein n=1 Tax=Lysinibacillus mangiferihumi TaxID=1130819 RepID=A0A4U2YGD0_9BACI|nr:ABC transporter substrate-binding protein [Lysinibacillus mangiferihumi]TKI60056.1 ABC transporter substrate-binding protein [Lysinibacillus mangiferihumi]